MQVTQNNKHKTNKTLVIFSGGFDSTTLLLETVEKQGRDNVIALSFNYGQKHDKEIKQATKICALLRVRHEIVDSYTWGLYKASTCSLMRGSDLEITHGKTYDDITEDDRDGMGAVNTSVPLRNVLFGVVAAIKAVEYGCERVLLAVHMGDNKNYAYPDCSPATISALHKTIMAATNGMVCLVAPYIYITKGEIAERLALAKNKELIAFSWSCYEGGEKHCGTCATCLERKAAFLAASMNDPTEYAGAASE